MVMMCLKDSSGNIRDSTYAIITGGRGMVNLLNGVSYHGIIFKAILIVHKNVRLVFSDIIYTFSLRKSKF